MADFNTHITTSTLVGVGVGFSGYFLLDTPEPERVITCMLATGLCSLAGILPDLDSGSGRPLRETTAVLAAVVPMLMIDRFQHMGLSAEAIALAGALIYITIRYGVVEIFKRYTVHRGMWHSIPAAIACALLAFLVVSGENIEVRIFKSAAVLIGFMVHLILDEIWSVEFKGTHFHLKKSFGTAIKFWYSKRLWPNISTYGKLILLVFLAIGDPFLMEHYHLHPPTWVTDQFASDPVEPLPRIASDPPPTLNR